MDPIEQKSTHSYPNADRNIGGNNTSETTRPLIHLSDVLSTTESKTEDFDYKTSTVHTFKDDMASEASKGNFSIGKIMAANNKKIHDPSNNTVSTGGNGISIFTKILIPVICILIVVGFSYVGSNISKNINSTSSQKNSMQQLSGGMLYAEQNVNIDVKGKSISNLYKEIQGGTSTETAVSGNIKSIVLNYQDGTNTIELSSSDFLNIIAPSAPDLLKRNLNKEYVFGYYYHPYSEPFIILKSSNYDSVFAGMLEWEKNMYADLGDLMFKKEVLASDNNQIAPENSASSSVNTTTSTPLPEPTPPTIGMKSEYQAAFIDKVISNNDARVLYRPNGEIAFFYTFFNKDTVIITTSEAMLSQIIYRLTSGKIVR